MGTRPKDTHRPGSVASAAASGTGRDSSRAAGWVLEFADAYRAGRSGPVGGNLALGESNGYRVDVQRSLACWGGVINAEDRRERRERRGGARGGTGEEGILTQRTQRALRREEEKRRGFFGGRRGRDWVGKRLDDSKLCSEILSREGACGEGRGARGEEYGRTAGAGDHLA